MWVRTSAGAHRRRQRGEQERDVACLVVDVGLGDGTRRRRARQREVGRGDDEPLRGEVAREGVVGRSRDVVPVREHHERERARGRRHALGLRSRGAGGRVAQRHGERAVGRRGIVTECSRAAAGVDEREAAHPDRVRRPRRRGGGWRRGGGRLRRRRGGHGLGGRDRRRRRRMRRPGRRRVHGLGFRRVACERPDAAGRDEHRHHGTDGDPHTSTPVASSSTGHCVTTPRSPMMIRGCCDGSSQRNTSSSCPCGSATQPAVDPPVDTCRKIALPIPGVRPALYAITAP